MITRAKSRLLSNGISTTNTSDQQPPTTSSAHERNIDETQSRNPRKQKTSNSDRILDSRSNLTGDTKQAHHQQSTPPSRQLPNEIVSLILNRFSGKQATLYECALVSKQFHAITTPLLWQAPDFDTDVVAARFLTCLSSASSSSEQLATIKQHIHELHLRGAHWTDDQLLRLLPHIPSLKHLLIYMTPHLTDTSFPHLPQQCRHLSSLKLGFSHLAQASFHAIGQHCLQLRDFEWTVHNNQSPEWLASLTACPLERLKIISLQVPLNENTMTIIKTFHRLTRLAISDANPGHTKCLLSMTTTATANNNNSTNDTVSVENTNNDRDHGTSTATARTLWPQLTHLSLYPCNDIDDTTLVVFIKSHPDLHELDLTKTNHLTDTSLDAVAAWLPHLTRLALTENPTISANGVRQVVRQCRRLETVDLYLCQRILAQDFPDALDPCFCRDQVVLGHSAMDKIRRQGCARE